MAKQDYEPTPQVPPWMRERYETMLQVLSGELSVSEGARRLGLSRNRFQTLLHRGMKGLLEGLEPGAPGRPARPAREVELEQQKERLELENRRLRDRAETIDRLLGVASGVIRGRVRAAKPKKDPGQEKSGDDDPGGWELTMRVEADRELRSAGLNAALASAVVGASPATVRRWRRQLISGWARADTPGPRLTDELRLQVAEVVRSLRGLIGAEALRHAVPGVSRRQAAAVKRETLTAMERERKADTEHVVVTVPGAVRGFDAMQVPTEDGRRYALVAADAAVPFRTSAVAVKRYDGRSVAEVLDRDFAEHGAPLVLRADRASCHTTPEVLGVLRRHGVLLLQGPPRHPGYYGQLERQNREHRAWLAMAGSLGAVDLDRLCDEMLLALNASWPRRTLTWRTSEEAWLARPTVEVDRDVLREEVQDRAARIRRQAADRGATAIMAERLAIESALTSRGYLRRLPGGWC
jgi:transposase InsO family protein/transposase-like protein